MRSLRRSLVVFAAAVLLAAHASPALAARQVGEIQYEPASIGTSP